MPAFTKECKLFPHEPLQQPKMQAVSCSGGKLTAKVGKKCKVCGNTLFEL